MSLAVFKFIPGWLAVIVISRDVVIMIGFAIFSINNIVVKIKSSFIGKCTTVIQLLAVFLVLLDPKIVGAFYMKWSLFWSVAVLTILSGLHYIYVGFSIHQEGAKNNQENNKQINRLNIAPRSVRDNSPMVGVAQVVEHRVVAPVVEGSSPFTHPIF